jgi:hypothetical protein
MNNIFCVTSYNSVGCTFIDWSVYFLTGQTQHYNVKSSSWLPVSQNPITELTAHGHDKNHPGGLSNTRQFITQLAQLRSDTLHSIYPCPMLVGVAAEYLNLPVESMGNAEVLAQIHQFIKNDYREILKLCEHHQIKTVYVASDPSTILYFNQPRFIPPLLSDYRTAANSQQHAKDDFQKIFFNHSLAYWKEQGLDNQWDVRERLALDSRPFDTEQIDFSPNSTAPYLWVNNVDLWTRTAQVIEKIMNYLQLSIHNKRLEQWLPICHSWQKIQLNILEFCYNQQHIVESIINNWHYEIDLTFEQEVVIQHCLIYQHGLNLKTWQLEKFPNNTKDLHKLLELNIHPVANIYSRLASQVY